MSITTVNTKQIKDATILDEDVAPAAAIAGTKISSNFGPQNVNARDFTLTGTGTVSSGSPKLVSLPASATVGAGFTTNTAGETTVLSNFFDVSAMALVTGTSGGSNGIQIGGVSSTLGQSVAFITANTERMRITSTGGVGIGNTPASGYLLDTYNAGTAIIGNSATSSALVIRSGSSSYIDFQPSGTTSRVRLDTAGNVGIGTTSPSAKLHVVSPDGANPTDYIAKIANQDITTGQGNGLLVSAGSFNTEYTLGVYDVTASFPRLVVRGDGFVGIGTASPATLLHIQGGALLTRAIDSTAGTLIGSFQASNSDVSLIVKVGTTNAISASSSVAMGDRSGNSLATSGSISVGTSTFNTDSRGTGTLTSATSLFLGVLAGDPSTPVAGQIWYNSTDQQFKGRNATSIVILG